MIKLVQKEKNGQRRIMAAVYRASVVAGGVYGNPGLPEELSWRSCVWYLLPSARETTAIY